ncbi:MAG: helix-turn-helix domain-containing protein [archaeon]|jgi:sugar-specific transcriptional regulator TrmB
MQVSTLRALGLSDGEAKLYLALVKLGSAFAGELTTKANINRTNGYDALERLIEKGLVSFIISDGKKLFSPTSPNRLKEILLEKQELLESELPSLEKEFVSSKESEQATVFRGRKGIKSVFEEILRENKPIFAYGAQSLFGDLFPIYQKQWNLRRVSNKVRLNIIYNSTVRQRKKESLGLIELKYLPKDYQFPSTTLICGDLTLIVAWEPLFVFYIRSKEVAKSNMAFFNILWKVGKN